MMKLKEIFSEKLFLPKANSVKKIKDRFAWKILFKILKRNK